MLNLEISVPNAREFDLAMAGFAADIQNLERVWPEVTPVLGRMVRRAFESEGDSGQHGEWPELSLRYKKRKARQYPGKTILRATDAMMESLLPDGAGHVEEISPTEYAYGSNVPYAFFTQHGFRTQLGKAAGLKRRSSARAMRGGPKARRSAMDIGEARAFVPARRTLDPTDGDLDDIRRAIQRGIVKLVRRRGFAVASGIYGPGEMAEVTGGEAFALGKSLAEEM
jgi:phage gpG-like protein